MKVIKSKDFGFPLSQSPPKIKETNNGNNYVLGIAIDDYISNPLNNCVKDLHEITQLLMQYDGFEPSQVTLLTNELATRKNVLYELRSLVQKLQINDNLILIFSGHGILDQHGDKEGYWMLYGCDETNFWEHGVNNEDIISYIGNMRARHILLLIDSCFSGSLFASIKGNAAQLPIDEIESYPSRWAITAGRIEPVSDGVYGGNSPFAQYIIHYLMQKINDGFCSATDLSEYIKRVLPRNSQQHPDGRPLQSVGDQGGIFTMYARTKRLLKTKGVQKKKAVKKTQSSEINPLPNQSRLKIRSLLKEKKYTEIFTILKNEYPHKYEPIKHNFDVAWNAHKDGHISDYQWYLNLSEISLKILELFQ
jgi:hypothetical protein